MADDSTNPTYTDHIEDIQTWLSDTAGQAVTSPENRDWCTLDISDTLNSENIENYFDNTDVNDDYSDEFKKGVITNIPIAFNQLESDHIQALAKIFIYRHQPRLKFYRDDCENKNYRTFNALSLSMAKLDFMKSLA